MTDDNLCHEALTYDPMFSFTYSSEGWGRRGEGGHGTVKTTHITREK